MSPTGSVDWIRYTGFKQKPCTGCGVIVELQHVFKEPFSAFNRKPDGSYKTVKSIADALADRARVWQDEPLTCPGCTPPEDPA